MATPVYIENFESWQEDFSYFDSISVRFSETDAFGHVNNTVAFIYFEQARINYFYSLGLMDEWVKGPYMIVTGDLQCDYRRQVAFGDKLQVGVKIASIGRTSIDVHYLVKNQKNQICMTGRGRIVQVEKKTGASTPWQNELLGMLEKA
ncbi:acyl-CoA thioesterase [Alkalicoccus daliensis]|uniref:Acyl-CoA thioester hydrolase n=1 Tax=Alkalicoccus daliensis TaxID=745820 RepID=A0A1H0CHS6_9BACI|nr:thioesterase family protein [Alkalicoccus daliensis]SDN57426.1 acyl-CoA thioester hydrolase [Alkalicoccus daliensis]